MTIRTLSIVLLAAGMLLLLAACGGPAAQAPAAATQQMAPTQPPAPTEVPAPTEAPTVAAASPADMIRGGVLYDHWTEVLGVAVPEGDQPLWKMQSTNTRTGGDTWRCKECHGWDYKGVEGAYGSGSHLTGFKGLLGSQDLSEADIVAWLDGTKNADHDFSAYFQEADYRGLAAFIKEGMSDTAAYINADMTVKGGDPAHGEELFTGVCQACHGEDGKMLNFGDESEPEYLGTIATDNPWEFWHKVTFGQPGGPMPAGLNAGWTAQDIVDLLSYVRTLPTE